MSVSYTNYKNFISKLGYTAKPSENSEEYVFVCDKDHINTLTKNSYNNKRTKWMNETFIFCSVCKDETEKKETLNKYKEEILELTGHTLLSLKSEGNSSTIAEYKCKNCGEISTTGLTLLRKNKGNCSKCNRQARKISITDIKNRLEKDGYIVLEYKGKENVVMKCPKEHIFKIKTHDFEVKGRRCSHKDCYNEKRIKTNIIRYGTENVFQSEKIKEKIKETNIEKYGVSHPLKNKEILERLKNSCKEKFGTEYAFCQDWVYKRIRETHKQKYGVEYPLQNREILDKIVKFSFSRKELILPKTGKILLVMGYEDEAIKYVLETNKNILEDDIIVEETPSFEYTDRQGKNRVYYPDFSIKNTNYIFEVKSIWTFNIEPEKNYCKFITVASRGYILKVLIYKRKKKLYDIWTFQLEDGIVKKTSKNKNTVFDKKIDIEENDTEDIDDFLQDASKLLIEEMTNNIEI